MIIMNILKKNFLVILIVLVTIGIFPAIHAAAGDPPTDTATFADGDQDQIYFSGDDLSFNLTGLPEALSAGTSVRVAFGQLSAEGDFVSTDVFSSGLTNGAVDGTGYYTNGTIAGGGTLSANISGTIKAGLETGPIAVQLFADMNGPMAGGWTDLLQFAGITPTYIPLLADSKPAMVGFDNVLPEGITTTPALSAIDNFYDSSLDITFTKDLGSENYGSIAFTNLNFLDYENIQQLEALDTGLNMSQIGEPAEGTVAQFTLGLNDTDLSFLAGMGATLSLTSSSLFNSMTAEDFSVATDGDGIVSGLSFDDATDTVTFSVDHFSSYTVSLNDPSGISFTVDYTDVTTEGGNDGSITISGVSGGTAPYTYSINDGTDYVAGNEFTGLTAGTYLVKVKDSSDQPIESAAEEVIIAEPVTPDAPAVTGDDTNNMVSGMAVGMEYKLDDAGYVAYNADTFAAIDFSGAHTLLVRVAAQGINPAGEVATLTFTANPPDLDNNYEIGTGSNIDAAADGSGNVYVVYESGSNIYFAKNRETPEVIPGGGSDSVPAIAVESTGTAHVAFIRSGNITYAKRAINGNWTSTAIVAGSVPDIDVDGSGYAHIVFQGNADGDGYTEILYTNNSTGDFAGASVIADGWYDSGSGNYYYAPSIKIDSNGKYHIMFETQGWGGRASWSSKGVSVSTNAVEGNAGVGGFDWNGGVTTTKNGLALIGSDGDAASVYIASGTSYRADITGDVWTQFAIGSVSTPAIAASGTNKGIVYYSSGIKYVLDTGDGFSGAANIDVAADASGGSIYPVVAVDDDYSYVYYEKGGKIYLATDKDVAPPIGATITDNDVDNVYFEGDTLSFNMVGLDSFNGQNMRVAFGTVGEGGVFTSNEVVSGLAESDGNFYKTATVSEGTFSSDISGTIQSDLDNGIVAVKIYYESTPDFWVNPLAGQPQSFIILSYDSQQAYVGIELPTDVTSTPLLGSSAQDTENLYNIDIAFAKTIATGITGKMAFTGIDLISDSDELASLNTAITMTKEVDSGAGNLENYTLGVDTETLAFLVDKGATVSVTSASFNDCETADFAVAAVDAEGEISNLAFDNDTDTVSFDVTHFSNYSLSLIDPSDANADGYYDPDVAALRAFLDKDSVVEGSNNGQVVIGASYDGTDPSTFASNGTFTWNSETPKRLTGIHWDSMYGDNPRALTGAFDMSSLTELTSIIIEVTDSNPEDDIAEGITAFNVAGLAKLQTLDVLGNSLTSLDVSGCSALTDLNCQENMLTSLTLTGATELTDLNFGYNRMTNAGINGLSALTKLETLWCYYNQLTSLDLSPFTALTSFDCQGNDLTSLNLSNNPLLEEVYCNENALGTLDLSDKTSLTSLYCQTNNITSLNLSGCTSLVTIYCVDNDITSLDLTDCTALQYLSCNGNELAFSSLPTALPIGGGEYAYAPQQAVSITLTGGNVVDLSSEATFGENNTTFTWHKSSDNSEITEGISESPTGVFTFDRNTYDGVGVYCAMTNSSFPDLSGENALTTQAVTILGIPLLDTPSNITLSGFTFTWDAVDNAVSYVIDIYSGGELVSEGITTTGNSIILVLLPGETFQSLPTGTYNIKVTAIGDGENYLDSEPSELSADCLVDSYNPLEQVNYAESAAEMQTALEVNSAAFEISIGEGSDYDALSDAGILAVAQAVLDAREGGFADNAAVASAFEAGVIEGVLYDEAQKYETEVTLAYDSERGANAVVTSLVFVLKEGKSAKPGVYITSKSIPFPVANSEDVGGNLLITSEGDIIAPHPNWTGSDQTCDITFVFAYQEVASDLAAVEVTIEAVPASKVLAAINEAGSAADIEAILDDADQRGNFGPDADYVNDYSDFTADEQLAVATAVYDSGAGYALDSTGQDALIAAYETACKQVYIDRAKAIIGDSFDAVEGIDENLIDSLNALDGISDTGVSLALSVEETFTEDFTYEEVEWSGLVYISITYNDLMEDYGIIVTVPAADLDAPVAGNNGTITVSSITKNSLNLNWTAAEDAVTTDGTQLEYYVVMSAADNISTAEDCEANGTPLNPGGTANITTFNVTGLSASTTYYFNIAVMDVVGNIGMYTTVTATTASSSGGGGGGGTIVLPPVDTEEEQTTTTTTTTISGSTNQNTGTTTASVPAVTANTLLNEAKAAESQGQLAVVEIKVETTSNTTTTEVEIPRSAFNQIADDTDAEIVIDAGIGTLTFDSAAVEAISEGASGDINISITEVDVDTLDEQVQEIVGDRPVFDFTVTAGNSKVSSFGDGSVVVGIPYTLKEGEDPNAVVIYYINDSGELEMVNSVYDPATGMVNFTTNHFSQYMIGYNEITFSDVADDAWYADAVTFIAARDITTGTSEGIYSPNMLLTRGQFIVMLMKAYGIAPDADASNFADAGNTYYTDYLAAAKELGIADGVGNNNFAPTKQITRQEMFTLLYRALAVINELPTAASGKTLANFSDASQIADYAEEAMTALVKAGVVSGNNGKLDPTATTNRAQMAQVLYNLLSE